MNLIKLSLKYEDGRHENFEHHAPILIGRNDDCVLKVPHWRVARRHAQLIQAVDGIYLEDLGSLSGTRVNGRRISRHGPIKQSDEVLIGPCLIQVRLPGVTSLKCAETSITSHQTIDLLQTAEMAEKPIVSDSMGLSRKYAHVWQDIRLSLIKAFDLRRCDVSSLSDHALRVEAESCVSALLNNYPGIEPEDEKNRLLQLIVDEAIGLGVLEILLKDSSISEIMVNRFDEIFIESKGKLSLYPIGFSCEEALRSVIDRIVFGMGRRIDEASPMVDARLKDGSRVNAVISPISRTGPFLTIRKFPLHRLTIDQLISNQSLDKKSADLLGLCVQSRLNMLVAGGTGSGKTTLLNILGGLIPEGQRIITIEDSAELQINHQHVLSLEARPENIEGQGRVSIRDLVKNALRMRPDRIVVGECRGAEALDMLIAMNTGHEGSMTTLHANTPRDAIARLETMVLMANLGLPLAAIREQIASAVQIVIQQTRLSCGRRLVSEIVELTGIDTGVIQMHSLMKYDRVLNEFKFSGITPSFIDAEQPFALKANHNEWMVQR
ncbi:Flp pilus assembly complex ATPase component [Orrella sp. NBD-18]|uniref:Flp pilus assembly complex ATPase component n=1 Tax=Sheuella amnicola TaxID=2707330 RepID=A0A6B2QT28_9BURK|nr:ATPase, T2SS/T4P/T4SS family [Sheuella amnicola]NDY81846.1 Flp pilus assembly complex ATPase component [Sheuella amnicola]